MFKFLIVLVLFYFCKGSEKYVSCGSDDEEEGPRICMTKYNNSTKPFCANGESNNPSKQCLPELCKQDVWIKENNQTSCLDKFLDGSYLSKGHCIVVNKNRCKKFY